MTRSSRRFKAGNPCDLVPVEPRQSALARRPSPCSPSPRMASFAQSACRPHNGAPPVENLTFERTVLDTSGFACLCGLAARSP